MVTRQIPIAEQVSSLLHQRIMEGIYPPSERLPSESELADQLQVSRGSVRTALATLAAAGLVVRRQGDGTYVRDVRSAENSLVHAVWDFARLMEMSGKRATIQAISVEMRPGTAEETANLELTPGDDVVEVVRRFCADDEPVVWSINVSPATFFRTRVEDLDATVGIHEFMERYCGKIVARVDTNISAVNPNEAVRTALALEPGVPIIRLSDIFRDINRHPLVYTTNYDSGNQLSLHDIRVWYSEKTNDVDPDPAISVDSSSPSNGENRQK